MIVEGVRPVARVEHHGLGLHVGEGCQVWVEEADRRGSGRHIPELILMIIDVHLWAGGAERGLEVRLAEEVGEGDNALGV